MKDNNIISEQEKTLSKKSINLNLIEIEAIKLSDIENLKNKECARKLKISVDEFNTMIINARKKTAIAAIEGIPINIVDNSLDEKIMTVCKFRCAVCGEIYTINYLDNKIICPLCHSNKIMTNKEAGFCK